MNPNAKGPFQAFADALRLNEEAREMLLGPRSVPTPAEALCEVARTIAAREDAEAANAFIREQYGNQCAAVCVRLSDHDSRA